MDIVKLNADEVIVAQLEGKIIGIYGNEEAFLRYCGASWATTGITRKVMKIKFS